MTGRNFWELEQGALIQAWLPDKFPVLPDILATNGYYVGRTGKGWGPGVHPDGAHGPDSAGQVYNEQLGAVLRILTERGELDNTLLIVTSDNGILGTLTTTAHSRCWSTTRMRRLTIWSGSSARGQLGVEPARGRRSNRSAIGAKVRMTGVGGLSYRRFAVEAPTSRRATCDSTSASVRRAGSNGWRSNGLLGSSRSWKGCRSIASLSWRSLNKPQSSAASRPPGHCTHRPLPSSEPTTACPRWYRLWVMRTDRRRFLHSVAAGSAGLLAGRSSTSAFQDRPLTGRIIDAESGQQVPARIRLLDTQDREIVPIGHADDLDEAKTKEGDVRIQSRRYCYTDGTFQLKPGHFPAKYRVLKGFEYVIAEGEFSEAQVRDGVFTIPLSRWSNLSQQGWYSGDIHIHHISPQYCRLEMEAENLNVANILTSDFTKDQHEFEGKLSSLSSGNHLVYVNQEYRHDHLGHLNVLNLKELLEPVKRQQKEHWPLHLDVCDRAHRQGGYVAWAHFPGGPGLENPLDVAMEKLDGVEISSQIEPRQLPTFMQMAVPELAANHGLRRWYRFLNCGFRLTPTAGTDKMETFVTVGANRVFAHLDGDFTYQGWIDALRSGRTFITNSPMLSIAVNGREPGAILNVDSKTTKVLEIEVTVESQMAYDRLEIVSNGIVIAQKSPSGPRHRAQIRLEHPLKKSCWIAARAIEDLSRYTHRAEIFRTQNAPEGTVLSNYFGTRRPATVFAHSSPVYVIRDSVPIRSWDDAHYYIRYLDNSIQWLRTHGRFARPADKQATIEAFLKGRAVYEQRALEARQPG